MGDDEVFGKDVLERSLDQAFSADLNFDLLVEASFKYLLQWVHCLPLFECWFSAKEA